MRYLPTTLACLAFLPLADSKPGHAADGKQPAQKVDEVRINLEGKTIKGLSLHVQFPDGETWALGKRGVGRPFAARLIFGNQSDDTIHIWDPHNAEGSTCPGVILIGPKGQKLVLRPKQIFRFTGVPSVWTLPPHASCSLDLELLRLVGTQSLEPGRYQVKAFYDNQLENKPKTFIRHDVWTGHVESIKKKIEIVAPK